MKALIFLSVLAFTIASEFHMPLTDNGEKFTEDISIDVAGNTEEIKVPKHKGSIGIDILKDFNVGLQAIKVPKTKTCLISAIDSSQQKPAHLEQSMKLAKSKFPEDKYIVEKERSLQVRKMSADEVGKKIASHCDGYDLIFTVRVTKKNAQKTALSLLKAMKAFGE